MLDGDNTLAIRLKSRSPSLHQGVPPSHTTSFHPMLHRVPCGLVTQSLAVAEKFPKNPEAGTLVYADTYRRCTSSSAAC